MNIFVTSLKDAVRTVSDKNARCVLSLLAPAVNADEYFPTFTYDVAHGKVEVDDVWRNEEAEYFPTEATARAVVEFLNRWRSTGGPLVVHCMAGVSRSAAAAMAAVYMQDRTRQKFNEAAYAKEVRRVARTRPRFSPNPKLVELLDAELGAGGMLVRTAEKARGWDFTDEQAMGLSFVD